MKHILIVEDLDDHAFLLQTQLNRLSFLTSVCTDVFQIIKKVPGKEATLQFGTEIFASKDGSVTALLGASPGASTSPYIMLSLMEKAFPEQVNGKWNPKLHEIVQSYGQDLGTNPALLDQVRTYTSATLGLNYTPTRKAANDATATAPAVANAN